MLRAASSAASLPVSTASGRRMAPTCAASRPLAIGHRRRTCARCRCTCCAARTRRFCALADAIRAAPTMRKPRLQLQPQLKRVQDGASAAEIRPAPASSAAAAATLEGDRVIYQTSGRPTDGRKKERRQSVEVRQALSRLTSSSSRRGARTFTASICRGGGRMCNLTLATPARFQKQQFTTTTTATHPHLWLADERAPRLLPVCSSFCIPFSFCLCLRLLRFFIFLIFFVFFLGVACSAAAVAMARHRAPDAGQLLQFATAPPLQARPSGARHFRVRMAAGSLRCRRRCRLRR